jgi:pimeloyl-ACP methyl ester carboxylesterase
MKRHAVALIPGFLGFDHRRGTTYFADRFVAGLRTLLEEKCGAPFPVVPVSTLPISSLAARQKTLLENLGTLDGELKQPSWHLVGHSTGGVVAALLARTQCLKESNKGSVFSDHPMDRERIASITTISAPHYGTGLALSAIAKLLTGSPSFAGGRELLTAGVDAFRRDKLSSRLAFVLPSLGHNAHFYENFVSPPLVRDLAPQVVGNLTMTNNRRSAIPVTSFATVAPEPTPEIKDKLFADLWHSTQENAEGAQPAPPPFPERSPRDVISATAQVPPIDARANDGVVSTNRQVYVGDNASFGGLIVGDHGDVIGRYQRDDPLDHKPIDPGLLTSGASFRDDQFFAVLARVASVIIQATRARDGSPGAPARAAE